MRGTRLVRLVPRWLLRIAGVLLLASAYVVNAQGDAAAAQGLSVLHFNMAGNLRNLGSGEVAVKIAASINSRTSTVVTLNEVCWSQFALVKRDTGMNGYFTDTAGPQSGSLNPLPNNCSRDSSGYGEDRYGNAVFIRGALCCGNNKPISSLSGSEVRRVTCGLATSITPDVEACVTHIAGTTYTESYRQVETALDWVNGFPTTLNRATIFGGDFNRVPGSAILDQMYTSVFLDGFGNFGEIAQQCGSGGTLGRCGAPTHSNGKIDYIWNSAGDFCCRSATVSHSDYSDHDILSGHISVK